MAASNFTLSQHFSRCERAQREIQIHTLGSKRSFAAFNVNVFFEP
jgi:hypothetical protein